MPSRVDVMHMLLSQHRQLGICPTEIHANKHTLDSFAVEAKLLPMVPPDTRSPLDRLLDRKQGPKPCLKFDGCELVVNNRIVGQAILIRPAALMHDPDWLNKIQNHPGARGPQGEQLIMPEGEETPWIDRVEPQEQVGGPALAKEPEGTLEALAQAGGVTCTDVLIKAMDGMDKVEHVVVLRFHKNKDVDICSTMNRFEIQGGLHKAMAYVMGGE